MNVADFGKAVITVVVNGGIGRRKRLGLDNIGGFLLWLWHAFRYGSVKSGWRIWEAPSRAEGVISMGCS